MKAALRVIQIGAIAVVVAVATFHVFELDRFFVPKELVLHVTAVLAALCAFGALRRRTLTRVDRLLIAFVLLGALSAIFATNRWLSIRAVAISASAVLLYWTARALREAGLAQPLLNALALAIVLIAVTSLLQTYGIDLDIFSENRAPGGTLGNRNFVAHAAAFGFPLVLLAALRGSRLAPFGVAIVMASLVLTRSRAAWLAFAIVVLVIFVALVASPLRRDALIWRRLAFVAMVVAGGVALALVIPNTLRWRSDSPYLETARRVADYSQGSGRGRLVQYQRSLLLALRHPLLGVGPGNWAVEYPNPKRVPRSDPSLNENEPGMTMNPWPSSDWIAFIAERGFAAAIVLGLAFLMLIWNPVRDLESLTLLATVAGVVVVGAFDAVLLLGLPALLVWPALGALVPATTTAEGGRRYTGAIVLFLLFALVGAVRSASQLTAMQIFVSRGDRASLERASRIDPGNYRLQMRLARMGRRAQRCEHARAAHALFPHAEGAIAVSRGCE